MPNDIVLLILDVQTPPGAELRVALIESRLPGFLVKSGERYRLIAVEDLDAVREMSELGAPVAVAGEPPGDARYIAFDVQEMRGAFAPGAPIIGEARVKLRPPRVLGMVVGGVVVYRCPIGPHTVMAHRVRAGRKCPQHPTQTVDP
jgi:hypothetical protein